MNKIFAAASAAAVALLVASPALAGWDRNTVWDPAFDRSIDRQLETNGQIASGAVVSTSGSAIATNDAPAAVGAKHWFGANLDRAVESKDSPYDN